MGMRAGRPVGWPLRRSKREPCSQHSIWPSSTSPSDRDTLAWLHVSSMAWICPALSRTMATGSPSISTFTAPTVGRSATEQASTKPSAASLVTVVVLVVFSLISGSSGLHRGGRAHRQGQLGVDRSHHVLLDAGDADPVDDGCEEAVHDQASGLLLGDAT